MSAAAWFVAWYDKANATVVVEPAPVSSAGPKTLVLENGQSIRRTCASEPFSRFGRYYAPTRHEAFAWVAQNIQRAREMAVRRMGESDAAMAALYRHPLGGGTVFLLPAAQA